jgi:fibronectin type 3 domain-containing protein
MSLKKYIRTMVTGAALGIIFHAGYSFSQEAPVIGFVENGKVNLRWPAIHVTGLTGYNVYRKAAGQPDWQKLNPSPLSMIRSESQIRQIAGYKADLFLQLFGADNPPGDITPRQYDALIANSQSLAFLDIMTMVNPEFGGLMGVIFVDSAILPQGDYRYKITSLKDGKETDYATSETIDIGLSDKIPGVTGFTADPEDRGASLSWDKNQEALHSGKIVSYAVYRADTLLGPYEKVNYYGVLPVTVSSGGRTVNENRSWYRDEYLDNGRPYYYFVRAINAFGFTGPASPTVKVVPGDNSRPGQPYNLVAVPFGTGLKLSWLADGSGIKGFEVYKCETRGGPYSKIHPLSDLLLQPDTSFIDAVVKPAGMYYYFVTAVNQAGVRSRPSDTLTVYIEDRIPPSPPGPVTANTGPGRVILRWPASTETDVIGYEVERSSDELFRSRFLLTNKILRDTVFTDSLPVASETTYGYLVYAVDASYNRSASSEMVKVKLPDHFPPSVPVLTGLERTGNLVMLTWTHSSEPDLAGYRIYRSKGTVSELRSQRICFNSSCTDTLNGSGKYIYAVTAIDSAGNESKKSGILTVEYDANEVPMTPPEGNVSKSGNFLRIAWQKVSQEGTAGYVVTRYDISTGKKLDVAQVKADVTSYTDKFADPEKEYDYMVRTYDERWRMSPPLVIQYRP